MLNKLVQTGNLTVTILQGVAVLTAIGSMAVLSMGSTKMVDAVATRYAEDARLADGHVATGDLSSLRAAHNDLLTKTALPGEAARNTGRLQVGLVSFQNMRTSHSAPYTPISLNIERLVRGSTLMIAEGPTRWDVEGGRIQQRAKLSFEGTSPIAARGVHQGLLAGTRIKPFDSDRAIEPSTVHSDKRAFCRSMNSWAKFYGIGTEKVIVTTLYPRASDPSIRATDRGFKLGKGNQRTLGTAADLCQ